MVTLTVTSDEQPDHNNDDKEDYSGLYQPSHLNNLPFAEFSAVFIVT